MIAPEARRQFILDNTRLQAPPHTPELSLHLADEITPIWRMTEEALADIGLPPPFWAFAWAGGQALARFVLDRPEVVRGLRVVDFASGSGLCAIAAAMAGAREVCAVERDPVAVCAIALNAAEQGVAIDARLEAALAGGAGPPPAWLAACEVVLAGDICYDAAMAARVVPWLRARAAAGAQVLLGDPGRIYLPSEGLVELARYRVPIIDDVEAEAERWGVVYRVAP